MKKIFLTLLVTVLAGAGLFVFGAQPVAAQLTPGQNVSICTFIGPICNALGINAEDPTGSGQTATTLVRSWVNLGITLLFIGIILIAVFIIVRAAITYIQSQGDEGKIAEAQKAIKSVFIGIALLFVGIVGIILVLAFFNATGLIGGNDDTCSECIVQCTLNGQSATQCATSGECRAVCQGRSSTVNPGGAPGQ